MGTEASGIHSFCKVLAFLHDTTPGKEGFALWVPNFLGAWDGQRVLASLNSAAGASFPDLCCCPSSRLRHFVAVTGRIGKGSHWPLTSRHFFPPFQAVK